MNYFVLLFEVISVRYLHFFIAVQCKKPWNYLASTLFTGRNKSVRFPLAEGTSTLEFKPSAYKIKFGNITGQRLFFSFQKVLDKLTELTSEDVKLKLSIIIWKEFGIDWLTIFKCNQDFKKVTLLGKFLIFF